MQQDSQDNLEQLSVSLSTILYKQSIFLNTTTMKQLFYLSLAFLAITGCRKIEMDGEKEIFVVTKEVAPVGQVSNTINLSGKITKDTTLYAKDVNFLSGVVYITKGVTLTIQEGARVQGKSGADAAALVICRGAKIIAKGTADKPIIFT
jgi:hypothetical protein